MAIRWKKHPRETGICSVGLNSDKRPSSLRNTENGEELATVYSFGYHFTGGGANDWYWVCPQREGMAYVNTCGVRGKTEAECKGEAMKYVKEALGVK